MIRINVGSDSILKLRAVHLAVDRLGIEAEIVGIRAASGVPNQPFGADETLAGARNRAREARMEGAYAVGIENGLVPVGRFVFDIGYVFIIAPDGRSATYRTPGVRVPLDLVEAAIANGCHRTVGALEAERSGCDPADPHRVWSEGRTDRETLLVNALHAVLSRSIANAEGAPS